MANPARTRLGKTAKKNYDATNAGNRHGSISFGHISADGAVTSDVCIQASDGRHGIRLEKDGPRKGCTQITGPGRVAIQSGDCLLYTSPSPRDLSTSRMPSSA